MRRGGGGGPGPTLTIFPLQIVNFLGKHEILDIFGDIVCTKCSRKPNWVKEQII